MGVTGGGLIWARSDQQPATATIRIPINVAEIEIDGRNNQAAAPPLVENGECIVGTLPGTRARFM